MRLVLDGERNVQEFNVHYRAMIRGRWEEIIRYDNSHGAPHVHRFWLSQPPRPIDPVLPAQALANAGIADIQENWPLYRLLWERAHP